MNNRCSACIVAIHADHLNSTRGKLLPVTVIANRRGASANNEPTTAARTRMFSLRNLSSLLGAGSAPLGKPALQRAALYDPRDTATQAPALHIPTDSSGDWGHDDSRGVVTLPTSPREKTVVALHVFAAPRLEELTAIRARLSAPSFPRLGRTITTEARALSLRIREIDRPGSAALHAYVLNLATGVLGHNR